MDIKTLESTVFTIMAEQLGLNISELSPDFDIIARGYADSLDLIELVMVLEEELGLEITDAEAEAVRPVTPVNIIAFFAGKFDLSYDADSVMAKSYKTELEQLRGKYDKLVAGLRSLLSSVDGQ